jgi:hypothetical protein
VSAFLQSVSDFWQSDIEDAGREPAVFALLGFLITFGVIRYITHAIRRGGSRVFRDVSRDGTHIHHLVWGILLLLVCGFLGIVVDPPFPDWLLPVGFGIGAALTLDEFALWLNLKDVYWSEEGRRSIDAVVIAGAVLALSLLGLDFWRHTWQAVLRDGEADVAGFHAVGLVLALLCLLRGRVYEALVAIFIPVVGLVGLVLVASPGSLWARRRYGEEKMAKARRRFGVEPPLPGFGGWRGERWRRRLALAVGALILLHVDWFSPRTEARDTISVIVLVLALADREVALFAGIWSRRGRRAAPAVDEPVPGDAALAPVSPRGSSGAPRQGA